MKLQQMALQKRERTNFQLQFAQEKYNELQNKLIQRLDCIALQIKNIQAIAQKQPYNSLTGAIEQASKQHKKVHQFYTNLKQEQTAVLLHKQINIQESAQLQSVLKEYEQRVEEMGCNLYTKQVDISVDHVGKLHNEKPTLSRLREFTRIKIQLQNIFCFTKKICDYTKNIRRLTPKNTLQSNSCKDCLMIMKEQKNTKQKINKAKNQKLSKSKDKDFMVQTARTKQSDDSSSSTQSNPQVEKSRCKRKMLVIKGQQKMYQQKGIFSDPQFIKLEGLIRNQKHRESTLRKQYQNLKIKLGNLCMQNLQLSTDYKKLVSKQKQNSKLKMQEFSPQISN